MDNSEKRIHTLAVLVDTEIDAQRGTIYDRNMKPLAQSATVWNVVLSQVSRMFTRKGYNIESLAVGVTHDSTISRITIEVLTDLERAQLLCNQLRKLLPVHSVKLLNRDNSIKRELLLIKVATPDSAARNEVVQIANIFRANTIDVSTQSITLAVVGDNDKNSAIEEMLDHCNILELVRTGIVALERGMNTIDEDTKEKGEFDYGKNVL